MHSSSNVIRGMIGGTHMASTMHSYSSSKYDFLAELLVGTFIRSVQPDELLVGSAEHSPGLYNLMNSSSALLNIVQPDELLVSSAEYFNQ